MTGEKTVIVIGGGITGLSAAYYLQKQARETGISLRVLLFERDARVGGKIETEVFNGFVVEKGPDSFLARKTAAVNLCRELGLEDDLVGTNPDNKQTYILHKGKLHRIPAGLNIGIPTQFLPFATTGLLSMSAKVRAAMDLVMPRSKVTGDQSLGGFLARRLGDEVVDHMAEPLLAGIYAGNSRNLSLRATFPQFESLEKKHGSLILGMLAQAKQAHANQSLPHSMFLSLRGGLIQLVDKLAEVLGPEVIRTSIGVREIKKGTNENNQPPYELILENGDKFEADAVVVTVPAFESARMLPQSFEPAATLEKIPYASVATAVMAFPAASITYPLDGTGFVVPKKEGRTITACTWVSSKWMHTAPPDQVLIRCYVGRAGDEEIVDESDESILTKVRQDLKDIMGIEAEAIYTSITRWRKSMPQYTVGHLDRLNAFEKEATKQLPGLFFAGAGFTGLGIPDCIQQGKEAAARVLELNGV
ncbi:protoporphyrinogen oxidase [Effusibacillus consociatus]|uniref:Coproporphyrinogen III oxidase n=1 Tax=Effusibacillus consociatus TaxID=1117041 RepID=A0ABV9Q572_9BACL